MKNKLTSVFGLVIIATIATLGLTGCGTTGAVATSQQQPASVIVNNSQQGIWVNGEGKVSVTPDLATLNLGISAQASTVAEAQSQAAAAMNKVMDTLTANGIDKKDIQTQYFSITQTISSTVTPYLPPTTSNGSGTEVSPAIPVKPPDQTITGYEVSNFITVKIRAIDKTGTIIDAAVAAGGDLVRINGVSFSIDQPDQYNTQARQLAMNNAKAKADQLANLAGVSLGKPTYISESSSTPVTYPGLAAQGVASSATTSISPGQTDIIIDVQVAYAIQ
jgi:uncharacterized protein